MQYFIDHKRKRIHQRQYAGDRCGFMKTPVEKREFTDSLAYIGRLQEESEYLKCPHCRTAQMAID
ncbi:hypothetical protein HU147_02395 [Planomicrobium chinense]|uniref:hypothetical protein n=1 Tax=Planococcus chinensis TaxID=272917 RepID=UPI001CC40D5E|nr:hypothetical protein [Planococcus chinensis]MBZ5200055.1 hypothetical protein [Planococcus chinensis]